MILAGAYPLAYVSNIHIPIIGSKVFMRFISKGGKDIRSCVSRIGGVQHGWLPSGVMCDLASHR